jgi:hypothetical protein
MPLALTLLLLFLAGSAVGQPATGEMLQGVVWTPPEDPIRAVDELRAMRGTGIEAIRMPATDDVAILSAADRFGFALFLDLPVEGLSATHLVDTLSFARGELDLVIAAAGRHPSIRAVGLAHAVNTSVPDACQYFEALTGRAREAGLSTYYRTRFIESDQCAATVDAVLLEARGRDPVRQLSRWRQRHETPAGIGAFGADVWENLQGGHLTPGSEAAQARTLENGLRALRNLHPAPTAVFVHQWRGRNHGLHAPDGSARLAASVVTGFYTGRQTVFAIDAGAPPPAPPGGTSFMIVGWAIALILILLLSLAPRFRELIPRYFGRHNYYREAVQRSASLEGPAGFGITFALMIAAGIVVGVLLHALATTDAVEVSLRSVAELDREAALGALRRPFLTVAIGSTVYGLWLLLNIVWLRVLAGRRYRIRPLQATILVVLSRWSVFVLAILALLAVQSENPVAWLPWLVGGWALLEVYGMIRMLYDFSKVARVPMQRAIVTGLGVPLAFFAVLFIAISLAAGPNLTFAWHLATRT